MYHQNHVVTLEITSGQVYRGKLIEGARTLANKITSQLLYLTALSTALEKQ